MLLGFDIGGTKCAVILGDNNKEGTPQIIDKTILQTNKPVHQMIESLFVTAETILMKNGLSNVDIDSIGISCGGPLYSKTGIILSPPNLQGWDNIQIVAMTEQRFGKKAILQNDANACALAEWKFGAGRGYQNVIFLTFGTGMGAGLILNGNLYTGTNDMAGEVGHIRLLESGPVGYGKAGSFEGFCSGAGIAQLAQIKAREILQTGGKTTFCNRLEDLPNITAKIVAESAYRADPAALEVYKTCGAYLGKGLAFLIDILNPEIIIIGGIYCRATSLLEPHMRAVIEQEALHIAYTACKIVPASLGENIGDFATLAIL